MEKGRRYSGGKKLNMKKVFAVIIAFAVIIMFIVGIKKILKSDKDIKEKTVVQKYFAVYTGCNRISGRSCGPELCCMGI